MKIKRTGLLQGHDPKGFCIEFLALSITKRLDKDQREQVRVAIATNKPIKVTIEI